MAELLFLKLEDGTFYYFIFHFYFSFNTTALENFFLPFTHRIVRKGPHRSRTV
uniref:Uncharacterized protein n=1 Tax=Meloidogyne enterolobii TaxID=390850 RepID=A0A6V7ULK0_MELEN|nr:unnamed protein product [Meloidogyne enterolobii]